jgi:hypothetical protein
MLSLQQHLDSPAHARKIYHCPTDFVRTLGIKSTHHGRSFKTLSSMVTHLESGKCAGGFQTFREAMEFVEGHLAGLGFVMESKLLLES